MRRNGDRRILLIGDYPPPMGGIAVHVQQLQRALSRNGVTCKVLNIGKGNVASDDVLSGRGYGRFSSELFKHAAAGWTLHLHTSGNNPKAWVVAMAVAVAGQMFRVPTVVSVHSGLIPQRFPKSPQLRRRAQVALVGFTHVVTVSDAVRETLLDLGLRPERVSMYPAFCPSEVIPGEPPALLEAARSRRHPLISAAHNPSPVYGRKLVMEAVSKLAPNHPDIGLALFGPGTGSPEYHADAERFGVAQYLEDFGELEHARALTVIAASDVFVRPTTADGDAVSVREALTLGIPCVATNVALRPEGTLVARAGDAADLARKIETALDTRPTPRPQPDAAAFMMELYGRLRRPPRQRKPRAPAPTPPAPQPLPA